ncbi:uncharacterized protein Dwil_GK23156 [Drosophila willistoni]|uniref:FXNA-like protease n=1 Tax=Drosophila willistoni TaxID=7260 RepID=B4NMI8_DROWI|nr:endoplasmic reticulum metallopeptidase 1 isoform X1 [Drosophila willistoni]EDW85577.2 uncharacterized protein Dwil_GK23156 [Drosophila willistoni]
MKGKNTTTQLDTNIFQVLLKPKSVTLGVPWYYALPFLLAWVVLFFGVVIPLFNVLPNGITMSEESLKPGEFVAERAQHLLYSFDRIGPKVVGSIANEVTTVAFLIDTVEHVRSEMRSDLYDIEVDVQQTSGSYMHWQMVNMYQSVQNVVVKLSTRSSNSSSYLLLNSHFDSKPSSSGSGDDGTMVVVMLEVLRQMAISSTVFEHPIVFLFNGAEENPLQASHGFITEHKWAPNCKALINLEVAGSGGRDLLFQSGPNHPWLMKYYNRHAKHPFATTMAEEIFQSGIVPSDTDFRNFRDYGQLPGLDIAQISNGYVYHTPFDNFKAVPRNSLQSTGENVLALVRAFSNATELYNTEEYSEGHSVFYDFLGLFLIYYTETTGIILNCCVAVISLVLVSISLWRIASNCLETQGQLFIWFLIILALQVTGLALSVALPLLMAVLFDAGNNSMSYFTNNWLVIGLYICPAVIGQVLPLTLYYTLKRNEKVSRVYFLHMSLHAHCVILAVIAIILTAISLRTPYLCMASMIFYATALFINLISTLHDRGLNWVLLVEAFQIMPFLYFCYLFHTFLVVFFPMMGRNGNSINPDLLIAILCAIGTFFAFGFVGPLINMFRWPKLILLGLGVVTFIFSMIAVSDVGFPYRSKTNPMRVNFLHTRRLFYEYNGSISLNDSGYYFDFQDRRLYYPLENSALDLNGLVNIKPECENKLMCGVPCFNHRWCKALKSSYWLPREENVVIPGSLSVQLLEKTILETGQSVRYEFEVSGPPHMSLYIQPLEGFEIENWSFIRNMLDNPEEYSSPYHIFISYGKDNTPLRFYIDYKGVNGDGNFNEPIFELGVAAHFISDEYERDSFGLQFISDFPDFVSVMEWPALYKRFVF